MTEELCFDDIAPVEIPVRVGNARLILREASGDAAARYRNAVLKATRLNADGKPSFVDGLADTEALLISRCLYYADDNGNLRLTPAGTPDPRYLVALETIRNWPYRVQEALFDKAREISGLDRRESADDIAKRMERDQQRLDALRNGTDEDHAKNLPDATTAGSD